MAARDDTYRTQRYLDIVFALSCVALLASMIWMFAKDYYREYRPVQQRGREVEVALLRRQAADMKVRSETQLAEARETIRQVLESEFGQKFPADTTDDNLLEHAKALLPVLQNPRIKELEEAPIELSSGRIKLSELKARQAKFSAAFGARKVDAGSLVSQRDILQSQGALPSAIRKKEEAIRLTEADVANLELSLQEVEQKLNDRLAEIAAVRKPFADAVNELDRLSKERDRILRLAKQKEIDVAAKVRDLPILDAFNPPFKIRQDIPDGLLIDYNFKQVNRLDRCATCHMFIDKAGYEKPMLAALSERPATGGKGLVVKLEPSEISVYANHPRLDLFAGSNSPHAVEKFGCTVCHSGHGGSATFNFAYHFPDTGKTDGVNEEKYAEKRKRWEAGPSKDGHNWHADLHPDYLWEYPMPPVRFVESSCLKCHHQVTDLIRTDGREEAPKVLKGYRLVRDLGCFGCHEISGYKSGRPVGPDLRLEPYPPLNDLTALERSKALADPNDPPGNLRKVGPGLRRIAEKTTTEWMARWIRSPRGFRPDTRMPHFFGLTNNDPQQLSDRFPDEESQVGDAQKGLPDAEIQAIAFFLMKTSDSYLGRLKALQALAPEAKQAEAQTRLAFQLLDDARRDGTQPTPRGNDPSLPPDTPVEKLISLKEAERTKLTKDQLAAVLSYFAERERTSRAAETLAQRPFPPAEAKDHKPNAAEGQTLFEKKSCVACHHHDRIKVYDDEGKLLSAPTFGPHLVGLREKLNFDKNPEQARKWLYYWLANPSEYHARTVMPTPSLTPAERLDIIAWLLEDTGNVPPPRSWSEVQVSAGDLEGLARAYLDKALPRRTVPAVLQNGITSKEVQYLALRPDADERILINDDPASPYAKWSPEERLKYYAGRKSIARYGCYACHDIPSFESAKPIGTPLNEWGKKDPERLVFENVVDFVTKHYEIPGHSQEHVAHASHGEGEGHDEHGHATNRDYDKCFFDSLEAHKRDGFLHQKLRDPRSYDYGKLKERPWDDRLKMPQFQFSHTMRRQAETDEEFAARSAKEEHDAIEAVMTFILGLTADPTPMRFVNQPRADRQAEVKGTKVLEKHNCIGCHVVKSGTYEFVLDDDMRSKLSKILANTTNQDELRRDHVFTESNAWRTNTIAPAGRGLARGLVRGTQDLDGGGKELSLELWEALRFQDSRGQTQQIPAGMVASVPVDPAVPQNGPTGGNFADVLARILAKEARKTLIGDRTFLMGSVPPPLIREGQKVQPQWLFDFLRQPYAIRPMVQKNLVMPRFNLDRDEVETLVHYFTAVDRLQNPSLGLDQFAPRPAVQDAEVQARLRAEYQDRVKHLGQGGAAQPPDYFEVGWRLLTNPELCVKCHNIGPAFQAGGKDEEKGPNLNLAPVRLRPEYLERWISNPRRLVPYTAMPQYDPFFAAGPDFHAAQLAVGQPTVRTVMQLSPLLAPVAGGLRVPADEQVYRQLQLDFALRPEERVRVARDALMSWGFLADPPPTAKKAGPR